MASGLQIVDHQVRARPAVPARRAWTSAKAGEWIALALVASAILPTAWSFHAASLRLTLARVILLLAAPYAMSVSLLGSRSLPSDKLLLLSGIWSFIALALHVGVGQAAESAGIVTLELVGSYSILRVWVTTPAAVWRLLSRLAFLLVPLGMLAILESVLHQFIVRPLLGAGGGQSIGARLGLMRAWATFDHPILLGVAMGGFFGLSLVIWRIRKAWWIPVLGLSVFLGTFASVSSGAAMVIVVISVGVLWERFASPLFARPWRMLGIFVATVWILVELGSNRSAMTVLLGYLTLSPGTAYGRQLIWEWGFWHNAWPNPLFGIGNSDWVRPSWMISGSMDNYWLYVAVYSGIPAALMQIAAVALLVRRAVGSSSRVIIAGTPVLAWAMTVVAVSMAGATVHFWNASLVIYGMLLGLGPALWISTDVGPRREAVQGSNWLES